MGWLWMFLQTFAPAAVAHSYNTTGPEHQLVLRKSLSVLFWNDSLIYSSIIFLSARTISLPFLLNSTRLRLASSVLRRGIRLWIPTAMALIICYAIFSKTLGTEYMNAFSAQTQNESMTKDLYMLPNSLANFNSIFDIFWTLWVVSVIFQQSYTVFMAVAIIPYTRNSWRLKGALVFILAAWWVYSWAWFSVTGLLFADLVVNYNFKAIAQMHRLETYAAGATCLIAGFTMQFLWVAAWPELYTAEIKYHTGVYQTGGLWLWNDATAPLLRADDYLVIVGFNLLLESTDVLQRIFRSRALVFIGKRSFSYFLLQSIIAYALGIKLVMNIIGGSMDTYAKASAVAFIVCLLVTIGAGEVFYWVIDWPTQRFACVVFDWIRE
ncbi:hypothetical protein K470DRAFT_269501 [Piedraia hortae CBS 480.64]|uniref:Acyltransferase 3 domain-containing protein n=1 Tax=Piedraia hortae CBS 480.64 TaxID=1314780 RepID=A0A6A7C393_9PEZI|nr:hypothetical protein K470DRAFT_269501 [Piedraia hortae CBS 480.64]